MKKKITMPVLTLFVMTASLASAETWEQAPEQANAIVARMQAIDVERKLSLESLRLKKSQMMALVHRDALRLRWSAPGEPVAYGVDGPGWLGASEDETQVEFLRRRLDLVSAVLDYGRRYGSDDEFLALLYWSRSNQFVVWKDFHGDPRKHDVFFFLKDDEYPGLPALVLDAYRAKYAKQSDARS